MGAEGKKGASKLNDLDDVELSGEADTEHLEFESATSLWKNKPVGAGADTKVNVFEAGIQIGTVARQLDFTDSNDFVLTEDAINDEIDIAINRNIANGIAGLDATGRLAKAQQHSATVYNDQANIYSGGGAQTFSGHISVPSTSRVFLDGGGDTYIWEQSADLVQHVIGGTARFEADGTGIRLVGTTSIRTATDPANVGAIRFGNAVLFNWRNAGNTANLGITFNASDQFAFAGTLEVLASNIFTNHPALASADPAADTLLIRDATDGLIKEVLPDNLGLKFSKGGTFVDPDVRNIIVWQAPFACTVINVKGYRVGGTGATINARKNGTLDHLSSDLSLISADTWTDGGAVQNTAYVAGDKLEIKFVTLAGTPTQVAIQVDFTRP